MSIEIIFKLDSDSRELLLRNPLIQKHNEQFDELVLNYVVVYRGKAEGTSLKHNTKVSTEVSELGFHPQLLIYGFRVDLILLPHDLLGSCRTFDRTIFRILPVAISRQRGGNLKVMGEISEWQQFEPTLLTGTLLKV